MGEGERDRLKKVGNREGERERTREVGERERKRESVMEGRPTREHSISKPFCQHGGGGEL